MKWEKKKEKKSNLILDFIHTFISINSAPELRCFSFFSSFAWRIVCEFKLCCRRLAFDSCCERVNRHSWRKDGMMSKIATVTFSFDKWAVPHFLLLSLMKDNDYDDNYASR